MGEKSKKFQKPHRHDFKSPIFRLKKKKFGEDETEEGGQVRSGVPVSRCAASGAGTLIHKKKKKKFLNLLNFELSVVSLTRIRTHPGYLRQRCLHECNIRKQREIERETLKRRRLERDRRTERSQTD